jgi:hypothetical protein
VVAQQNQNAMLAAMVQKLGPQAISAMGGLAKQGMQNAAQNPTAAPAE